MSQSGAYFTNSGPGGFIQTLTGNSGGAVPPTAGNINVIGSGDISVAGNAGTSTLTISLSGTISDSFVTDAGTATPIAGVLNILGTAAQGISTSGAGNTVTITAANATTTQKGVVALATNAEAIAGTDTAKAITADDLKAKLGTQTNHGVLVGAGTAAAVTALAVGTTNTVLLGNTGADPSFGQVPNAALQNSSITINAGTNITVTGSPVSLGGAVTIAATQTPIINNYTTVNSTPYVVTSTDYYMSVDTNSI